MNSLKVGASLGGVVLVGLGVAMAIANPTRPAYEEYALRRLTDYLKDNGCEKVFIAKSTCLSLIDDNQETIKELIAKNTEQQNFVVFSLYKTELSPPKILLPVIPSYQFETVGAFQTFYTYKLQKK